MILYVILFFIALCIGMATSVYAFGTGGKRKKIFEDIYFSVEEVDGIGVVYTKNGDYSAYCAWKIQSRNTPPTLTATMSSPNSSPLSVRP